MKTTNAEKRKILFKKKKGLFKDYFETSEFKEPILILMKRNQKAEFFEKATQGTFEYEHSDGTKRNILLNTKYLQSFPYGNKTFKGYICHEDHPLPLPEEPTITAETVGIAIDKTLNDIKKWKAEEFKAKGEMFWKIGAGIAIIGAVYVLYVMLRPQEAPAIIQTVKETTVTLINQTPTIIK